jgi:hypothetical protein
MSSAVKVVEGSLSVNEMRAVCPARSVVVLEAMAMARRFLSYLPLSAYEAPPVLATDPADPPDRREEELFTLIPRKRITTFDVPSANVCGSRGRPSLRAVGVPAIGLPNTL